MSVVLHTFGTNSLIHTNGIFPKSIYFYQIYLACVQPLSLLELFLQDLFAEWELALTRCFRWQVRSEAAGGLAQPSSGEATPRVQALLLHQLSHPWIPLAFQALVMKGNPQCMCRFCALMWGLRELVQNGQVKRIFGAGDSFPIKHKALPPFPVSPGSSTHPHGTHHLGPVTAQGLSSAPTEMQDPGGWHKLMPQAFSCAPRRSQGPALCTVYLSNVPWVHKKK